MSDERWTMPPHKDFYFYQRKKHDKWREVPAPAPALEAPIADTHAHLHLLPDPLWELKRAAANGVGLIGCVADPTEDDLDHVFELMHSGTTGRQTADTALPSPRLVLTMGVHPHNAKNYSPEIEDVLVEALSHPDVRVVGEIGLDYHYDLSPRETQQEVFRRQIQIAKELGMPIALHLRSGKREDLDDAHRAALEILKDEGFPAHGTLLHCCSLAPEQLEPWIESDCYVAYGGAFTFKNSEKTRQAASSVPPDRLLFETDSPYMTPEPMRGTTCTPAHVIFTAARIAEELGKKPGDDRKEFLETVWANSNRFFNLEDDSILSKGIE